MKEYKLQVAFVYALLLSLILCVSFLLIKGTEVSTESAKSGSNVVTAINRLS